MTRLALELAGFESASGRLDLLLGRNLENSLRYYRTLIRLPNERFRRAAQRDLNVLHPERLLDGLAVGRGVVLVTAHLGNFELAASWVAQVLGARVAAPAKRSTFLPLRYAEERARSACGVLVRRPSPGLFDQMVADLRSGAVVPVMMDRRPASGGCQVRLFGRAATAPPAPALLASRSEAPIIPSLTYSIDGGKNVLWFGKPMHATVRPEITKALDAAVQRLATWTEQMIATAPDQWHVSPDAFELPFNHTQGDQ